jgi:hypothetical protein
MMRAYLLAFALILAADAAHTQDRGRDTGVTALDVISSVAGEAESLGRKVIIRQIRIAPGQEAAELDQGKTGLMIVQLRAGELVTVVDGERRQRQEGEWWTVDRPSAMQLQTGDDSVILDTILIVD